MRYVVKLGGAGLENPELLAAACARSRTWCAMATRWPWCMAAECS